MPTPTYQIELLFPDKQVKTLDDLALAVSLRLAIVTRGLPYSGRRGYLPAARVYNLNASIIHRWLRAGMFIHIRKDEPTIPSA